MDDMRITMRRPAGPHTVFGPASFESQIGKQIPVRVGDQPADKSTAFGWAGSGRRAVTIYVAMVNDRHSDPEPELFATAEAAIDYARTWATDNAHRPDDFEEQDEPPDGWLYYASYSVEGDSVWVLAKEIDAEVPE